MSVGEAKWAVVCKSGMLYRGTLYVSLEFRRVILSGDINLGVIRVR